MSRKWPLNFLPPRHEQASSHAPERAESRLGVRLRVRHVAELVGTRGAPRYLRSDTRPGFISTAVLGWVTEEGIETARIAPGKPWQNGTRESFNGKFRNECLSMEWFRTQREAAATIETWRRPHSSLGYLTPNAFRAKRVKATQSGAAVLQDLLVRKNPGRSLATEPQRRRRFIRTS
jgi:putative transposase